MSVAPIRRHRGIVLVIALIMLALISLLAALSLRNAASTESVSSVVRVTELATQAAEIALRHCESSLFAPTPATLPTAPQTSAAEHHAPRWQDIKTWDRDSEGVVVLPLDAVNQAGAAATFRRPPECMVERLPILQKSPEPAGAGTGDSGVDISMGGAAASPTASITTTTTAITSTTPRITAFVITARGFGPEVPAEPPHGRPQGTEVWLQSHLELKAEPSTAPRVLWRAWRQLFMR